MSKSKKIDLSAAPAPLAADPFAALGALDTAALPPGTEPVPLSPPSSGKASKAAKKPRLLLRREKKDRGGKTVVVASGFPDEAGADEALRTVRKALGCGGTLERANTQTPHSGFEIVIQGDHPAAVAEALGALGYPVGGVIR